MISGDDESRISERPYGPLENPADHEAVRDLIEGELSESELEEERDSRKRSASWLLRIAAPVIAAVALIGVIVGEADDVDSDLQLYAPTEAMPGAQLPLRAMLYDELHGTQGPKVLAQDVEVRLHDEHGERLARTILHAANGGVVDMEGTLQLPTGFSGRANLSAQVSLHGSILHVETPIRIVPDARGMQREGRTMRPLQFFAEGPLRPENGQKSPSALSTRVLGGACVPEEPCTLLVNVGEPVASVSIEPSPSVSIQSRPPPNEPEQSGVRRYTVVTHGPEAQLTVHAVRGGMFVASRSVRLPIVQSGVTPIVEPRMLVAPQMPELSIFGEPSACVIDLFALDASTNLFWQKTTSLRACTRKTAWPFGALAPGIYRVQIRRDAFSAGTAAVAAIYVRAPGETAARALATLALRAEALGATDALATAVIANPERFAEEAFEPTTRYLLALLESDLVVYPPVLTAHADNLERLRMSQMRVRAFAMLALALAGVSLAFSVAQRGLRASRRASSILIDAGQEEAAQRRARMRSLLTVIASAFALLLVFVVIALYVMARGFLR